MSTSLPQFMILVFERELYESASSVAPAVLQAHFALRRQVTEIGGRIVAGHAVASGVTIRDNEVTPGQGSPAFAGYFIVEASDFDHAVWIGRMIPVVDGWVEVRPMVSS